MPSYLFQFGFFTPEQCTANDAHGWDDESSEALLIEAETEDAALEWGREVAEAFTAFLFADYPWHGDPPSWKEDRFAHWVEDPQSWPSDSLEGIPSVQVGEMPDVRAWVQR